MPGPLAADLHALGHLVRVHRLECELSLLDAADYTFVKVTELSRIEDGLPVETELDGTRPVFTLRKSFAAISETLLPSASFVKI